MRRGYGLLVGGLMLMSSIAAGSAAPTLADQCRAASGTAVIFVDVTTQFAEGDAESLTEGVVKIVQRAPPGRRIRIATITESFSKMRVLFDTCVPGCRADDGDCGELRSRKLIPEFDERLQRALTEVVPHTSLPRSDIALTLAYALRTRSEDEGQLYLYAFSDMLERSRSLDLVAVAKRAADRKVKPEALRKEALEALKRVGFDLDLKGVTVTVFGFGREDSKRDPLDPEIAQFVRLFWTDVFRDAGASRVGFHAVLP